MQIGLDIQTDFSGIYDKLSRDNINRGLFAMIDAQAIPDMNNYVPLDGGELRMSAHREQNSAVWDTPYADAQFYGTNGIVTFREYTTPGTGPEWHEVAKSSHINDWTNAFVRFSGLN